MKTFVLGIFIIFVFHYLWYRYNYWQLFQKTRKTFNLIEQAGITKNEDETAQFLENLSSGWRKSGQIFYFKRYDEIINILKRIEKRPLKILDIGCADGYLLEQIVKNIDINQVDLFGVDISPNRIALAKQRLNKYKNIISLDVENAEELSHLENKFDIIISVETIEHLISPQKAIDEIKRITKNDGAIVITVPSRHLSFISDFKTMALLNPLIWIETLIGLFFSQILPPFHNLYQPQRIDTVIHRAFTFSDVKKVLGENYYLNITTSDFLFEEFLPPSLAKIYRKVLYKLPILNRLGRRLIIRINKND
ncbi:MAG: class I SAM-dependent methyltransferase [Patescibacteria group bacterium]|nr:class I SAM-dependent methyltransferase [Patescibacteria group bacterium]MDD5121291.1 class I SAM-dependent methyltransferase [Patescibacteria group bacterium]MDD5221721.1 class I SAM-dependent methyltransferase [Patescibacteria group bacterium]MDD5395790.1 class I SAM-dependent methyltransferase [Patescibacteria group bacterium]